MDTTTAGSLANALWQNSQGNNMSSTSKDELQHPQLGGLKRKADWSSFSQQSDAQKLKTLSPAQFATLSQMPCLGGALGDGILVGQQQTNVMSISQQNNGNDTSPVLPPLNVAQFSSNSTTNSFELVSINHSQTQNNKQQSLQMDQFTGDMSWTIPTPMMESNCSTNVLQPSLLGHLQQQQQQQQPMSTNSQNLRAFLQNPNLQSPVSQPQPQSQPEPSCVHRSCQLFPTNEGIIKGAVELDPGALRRKAPVDNTANAHPIRESYGYPLNIAIRQDASLDVLKILVNGAPDVISCPDGRDESGSLSIVLRRKPNDLQILHLLIIANPDSLRMKDRRQNSPLHVAVARGASIDVVKPLYLLYPDAIMEKNINGETPFDISQRTVAICSDAVVNFLQTAYNDELRRRRSRRSR